VKVRELEVVLFSSTSPKQRAEAKATVPKTIYKEFL